jgi:hypothetical protein
MNYERQLKRLTKRCKAIEKKHSGNEADYTYYGGFDLGYLQGQISILEEIVSDINDQTITIQQKT